MKTALLAMMLIILATLSACAGKQVRPPPAPEVVEIKTVIPVPCVDELPERVKIHEDFELLAMNDYDFVQAIHSDRLALDKETSKLWAILTACKGAIKRGSGSVAQWPEPTGWPSTP
jgi:hypothetical protein